MNLDEYRAFKAEQALPKEETTPNAQTNENTTVVHEQVPVTQGESTETPQQPSEQNTAPVVTSEPKAETIEIDGKQVSVDELKSGYLRQSDYTRKTQELARIKKDLEKAEKLYTAVQEDPDTAMELAEKLGIEYVSAEDEKLLDIQTKYEELVIEREIEKLQAKYGEFDVTGVLQLAYDRNISDLDDAYHLAMRTNQPTQTAQPALDIESIKEQIRQDLLKELQLPVDTSTIISTRGTASPIEDNTPQLTPQEIKVANAMRMPHDEYVKWKSKK